MLRSLALAYVAVYVSPQGSFIIVNKNLCDIEGHMSSALVISGYMI